MFTSSIFSPRSLSTRFLALACASLASLTGLDNIDANELNALEIRFCPDLEVCAIRSICNYLMESTNYQISNNGEGCMDAEEISTICTVILDTDSPEAFQPQLYPNPSNGKVQLSAGTVDQIQVIDLRGKTLLTIKGPAHEIDLSAFPPSLYFVLLQKDNISWTQRLVKK